MTAPQRVIRKHGTGGYAMGCKCDVCRGETAAYRARKRAEARESAPPKPEPEPLATVKKHGIESGYTQGCRAACCRGAHAKAQQRRRSRNGPPLIVAADGGRRPGPGSATAPGAVRYVAELPEGVEHGTGSAYIYWRCRCPACTEGNNMRQRERVSRRRGGDGVFGPVTAT